MSLPDSNSESSDDSKDSDSSFISSFDMEVEDGEGEHVQKSHVSGALSLRCVTNFQHGVLRKTFNAILGAIRMD